VADRTEGEEIGLRMISIVEAEKGLNVDGSREAMIAALKSHSSQG
jgi:hypothetical protein